MNKVFLIVGICLLVFFVFISLTNSPEKKEPQESKVYQGPVPLGYDLEHFRLTGETIKEVVE